MNKKHLDLKRDFLKQSKIISLAKSLKDIEPIQWSDEVLNGNRKVVIGRNDVSKIIVELQITPECYNYIKDNIVDLDDFRQQEFKNRMTWMDKTNIKCPYDGIKATVIFDNKDLKINQAIAIYNDGDSKVVNIFKLKE